MPAAPHRAPLDPEVLRAELVVRAVPWRDVEVLGTTSSTNLDAVERLRGGAATGAAVVADEQTAGRGRLQRAWASPRGASLSLSVVLRPTSPADRWGWLPLLTGVAVVEALAGVLPGRLKWPNDLVVDVPDRDGGPGPRKWGGILAERTDLPDGSAAVVVGTGLNIDLALDELPTPAATSLVLEATGSVPRREAVTAAVLDRIASWFRRWDDTGGDATACGLRDGYRAVCASLGRDVRVELPVGSVTGRAVDIDPAGRLLVDTPAGCRAFSSGEIVHLRTR